MSALIPSTACSGATESPWPKRDGDGVELAPMLGKIGSAAFRAASVRSGRAGPASSERLVASTPMASAMRAAPMFEE